MQFTTLLTQVKSPTTFTGGSKSVAAAATPEALVASSTPCRFVWIGAPCDSDGVASNTKPVFIGDSSGQNIPIATHNFEGVMIQIDDAQKVYAKVGVDGESVEYRIFN
jgi:hypothetical protein